MWKIFIALLISALLSLISYKFYKDNLNLDKKNLYRASKLEIEDLVTMPGIVHSKKEAFILPFYNGYVRKIFVQQGDKVKKYDSLVTISKSSIINEEVYPLKAPFDGTITLINKTEGCYVNMGDPIKDFILKLEDLSEFYFFVNLSENDILKIQKNHPALIKLFSIPGKIYTAIVWDFSLSSKDEITNWGNSKAVFPIKLKITSPDNQLYPGMSGVVDISIQKKTALAIPHGFLHQDKDKEYIVLKDGSKKEVKIGLITPLEVEIIEGLEEGEEIQPVNYFKD